MNGDKPVKPADGDDSSPEALPELSARKFESIFEKFEMMAMRQGGGLNLGSLNETQRDKLLGVVEKNEEHAFEYFKEKLKTKKEIKLKEIEAGNFTFRTNRITMVIVLLALFVVTVIILYTKDNYFVPWLTFLTGLIGGYGFAKTQSPYRKLHIKEDNQ